MISVKIFNSLVKHKNVRHANMHFPVPIFPLLTLPPGRLRKLTFVVFLKEIDISSASFPPIEKCPNYTHKYSSEFGLYFIDRGL